MGSSVAFGLNNLGKQMEYSSGDPDKQKNEVQIL